MAMIENPLLVLAALCGIIALSEWLVQKTLLRQLGTGLLVIVMGAVFSNAGLIPSGASAVRLYAWVFDYAAPLAIFYLLLHVNLRSLRRAGGPMIFLFLAGAVGTILGVVLGMWLVDGPEVFGARFNAVAGMFTGTYIGGSVNFNAVALHYGVANEAWLFAGANAVDNIITTVWMIAGIGLPRLLRRFVPDRGAGVTVVPSEELGRGGTPLPAIIELGILLAMGLVAFAVSDRISGWSAARGVTVPSILILTTLAVAAAQVPSVHRMKLHPLLGQFTIYLFLTVIGAYCDLGAMRSLEELAPALFGLTATIVLMHGVVTFLAAGFFFRDWDAAAVASQANIGGPPSAAAIAESLGRDDLLVPAVLVGVLGYGVGTYLGFFVAEWVF